MPGRHDAISSFAGEEEEEEEEESRRKVMMTLVFPTASHVSPHKIAK